jgi:hypothetical protein
MRGLIFATITSAAVAFAAGSARADEPLHSVGTDVQATRIGEASAAVWVTTLDFVGEIGLSRRVHLVVRAPFALSELAEDRFLGMGNLTGALRWSGRGGRFSYALQAGVSAPTEISNDESRGNALLAATAELFRDAGRFLPDTTTYRIGAGAAIDLGARGRVFAGAALHDWHRSSGHTLVVPLALGGEVDVMDTLHAGAALLAMINPYADDTMASALELTFAHRGRSWIVGGRLDVPLDEAGSAGMIGAGVLVARRF